MLRRLPSLLALAALALLATFALTSCASNELSSQILQAHVGITSTLPSNGSTTVSVDAPGIVTFLDAVDAREGAVLSWVLTDAAGADVPGTIDLQPTTATFTPLAALAPGTAYRYSITTGVRMVRGQIVRDVYEWSFATEAAPGAASR